MSCGLVVVSQSVYPSVIWLQACHLTNISYIARFHWVQFDNNLYRIEPATGRKLKVTSSELVKAASRVSWMDKMLKLDKKAKDGRTDEALRGFNALMRSNTLRSTGGRHAIRIRIGQLMVRLATLSPCALAGCNNTTPSVSNHPLFLQ